MKLNKIFFFYNLLILASTFSLLLLLFSCFISENPLSPSPKLKQLIIRLLPQGWGFFTRDPREQAMVMYKINDDKSLNLVTLPNSSSSNLYGFSRKNRRVHLEFLRLYSLIPQESWRKFSEKSLRVPQQHIVNKIIANGDYFFLTNTNYMLLRYNKPTWLYLNNNLTFDDKKEFVIIEFSMK